MILVKEIGILQPPSSPNNGDLYILGNDGNLSGEFKNFKPLDLVQYSDLWIKLEVPVGTIVKSNYDGSSFKLVPKNGKTWLPVKL